MRQRLLAEQARKAKQPVDTTAGLWDHIFRVRVPQLGSRSVEDIRLRGVHVSGIKEVDEDMKNRLIVTWMNIDTMIELYRADVPVRVCNPSDTKKIYEFISEHIQLWKQQLQRGINVGNAPYQDLLDMDRFANSVYEHARFEFRGDGIDHLVAQHFAGISRVNPTNFFKTGAVEKIIAQAQGKNVGSDSDGNVVINGGDELPKRDSYEDFFRERFINASMRGRG